MSRPVITLTTDFGMGSPYVAQMKGVILSINPEIVIVDISHQVAPQDVRQAALILEETRAASWKSPWCKAMRPSIYTSQVIKR